MLTDEWNSSNSTKADGSAPSVPGMNKKFKRKSRQPKRLYSSPPPAVGLEDYGQDNGSADETPEEPYGLRLHAPPPKHSYLHKPTAASSRISPDGNQPVPSSQTGALDMRIGHHVPAITAKLSQSPGSQLPHLRASRWSSSVSQHQSNGNPFGPAAGLPTVNTSHDHAPTTYHPHPYSEDLSLPCTPRGSRERGERAGILPVSTAAYRTEPSGPSSESQDDSPKGSGCREGPGEDPDLGGPEVKGVQQTRRLLANARERTRVHTISAAFEALRKQVPCYSYGQKLSKLAILRIACNYILSLAQLTELDSADAPGSLTFSQCVEQCTRTLQAEGRSKKRKE